LKRPSLKLTETARQMVQRLDPETKHLIRKTLDDLSLKPFGGKPLRHELEGLWSAPVGHHRVIYQIIDQEVTVVFIGRRTDVYERLRELLAR
jgi:mRNA-degrading endonuclease RelE of RelBE toxin-antitoxin system